MILTTFDVQYITALFCFIAKSDGGKGLNTSCVTRFLSMGPQANTVEISSKNVDNFQWEEARVERAGALKNLDFPQHKNSGLSASRKVVQRITAQNNSTWLDRLR